MVKINKYGRKACRHCISETAYVMISSFGSLVQGDYTVSSGVIFVFMSKGTKIAQNGQKACAEYVSETAYVYDGDFLFH